MILVLLLIGCCASAFGQDRFPFSLLVEGMPVDKPATVLVHSGDTLLATGTVTSGFLMFDRPMSRIGQAAVEVVIAAGDFLIRIDRLDSRALSGSWTVEVEHPPFATDRGCGGRLVRKSRGVTRIDCLTIDSGRSDPTARYVLRRNPK